METPLTDAIRALYERVRQDVTLSEEQAQRAFNEGLDEICVKKEDNYLCPMCGNGMPLGGYHFGTKKVCRGCYEAHKDYIGASK